MTHRVPKPFPMLPAGLPSALLAGVACLFLSQAQAGPIEVAPDARPTPAQVEAARDALSPDERGEPFSVGFADLNDDGRPDLIARFYSSLYCGSAGCVSFAILAQADGYARQAIALPNFMQKMTVLDSRHLGMRDLRFDDAHHVFEWDGKAYR